MKHYFYIFLLLTLFLSGCVQVDYVGQRLKERDSDEYIMIYPSMQEVPAEYKVLGRGKVVTPNYYDLDKLDAILTEKAQEVGADAVAVASQRRVTINVSNDMQSDFQKSRGIWNSNSTTFDGKNIYTDSFGRQQNISNVKTERYRIYYQVVFLTKQNVSADIVK